MTSNQNHTGSGHNIGRDLINNYYSVNTDDLTTIVYEWMYQIATNQFEVVLNKIDTYRKLPLSEDVVNLFLILTEFINSVKDNTSMDTHLLKSELNNHKESNFNDLYNALLVKALVKENFDTALELYRKFDSYKIYTLACFDQHFANKDELQTRFDNKLSLLDDYSLFYLAQGFWRIHNYTSALKAFETISISRKSETILYWIIACKINIVVYSEELSFSYFDQKSSRTIEKIAHEFEILIKGKNSLSSLATHILISLVKLTSSNLYLPKIHNISLEHRRDIGKIDEKLGMTLNQIADKTIYEAPDWIVNKLERYESLNDDEVEMLIRAIYNKSIDMDTVEKWLLNSKIVSNSEEFYVEFLKLFILSFKVFSDSFEINNYRINLNNFLNEYSSRLKEINPTSIKYWCDNLHNLESSFEVIVFKILEAVCHNLAVNSDLNYYYLQSLFRLNKLKTMRQELNRIKDDEWSHDLYLFRARYYLKINDYPNAKENYLKFIADEKNLFIWHEFLVSCMGADLDFSLAKVELRRIPKSILTPKYNGFDFFINQLQFIDFNFAEQIIVGLFTENPIDNAPIIVKFYFNSFSNNTYISCNENKNFKGIHRGIVYKTKNQSKIALIVDSELAKHKELISIDSELGQILVKSSIGQKTEYNFNTVTIIEYQSVSTTVFQLAKNIVSELQHTYPKPIFYEPEIREDAIVEDTIKVLQKNKQQHDIADSTEVLLSNTDLTIYLKGKLLTKNRSVGEEIDIVYSLLLNKHSNQGLLNIGGNFKKLDFVLIDIYGAVYLSVTKLYKSVMGSKVNLFMSKETANSIQIWIDRVTNDKFLTVNEHNGQLFKTDANTVKQTHGTLINGLNALLNYVRIEPEKVIDVPTIVTEIKDLVSSSVISSIRLSVSNDIPWLCLDASIGSLLNSNNDFKIVGFLNFIEKYVSDKYMSFEDRKEAITLSAYTNLYTTYYLNDLVELAKDINEFPTLTQILNHSPLEFREPKIAEMVLVRIIKSTIQVGFKMRLPKNNAQGKSYLSLSIVQNMEGIQGNIVQKVNMHSLLYACFSKAIKCVEGTLVETKLAKLVIEYIQIQPNKKHRLFFFSILESFAFSHFISIDSINNSVSTLIENLSNES